MTSKNENVSTMALCISNESFPNYCMGVGGLGILYYDYTDTTPHCAMVGGGG